MDFHIPRQDPNVMYTFQLVAAFVGAWRGGWEGKVVGGVLVVQVVLAILFDLWSPVVGLLLDAPILAIFLYVVLRSRRYWTVWAAATMVLYVVTDILAILFDLKPWAWISAQIAFCYILVASLLVGTLAAPQPAWPRRDG